MSDDLKKLLDEATSLPWFVSNTRSPAGVYAHVVSEDMYIADCEWDSMFGPADAALICAAVNAVPELLALREENARLKQMLADAHAELCAGQRLATELSDWHIDAERCMERARAALNQEPGHE